ncbi:MAG: nucleoside hydrolase [Lachnospiraceae bacterium]|nr:nucleoside hydrolase [Lachnospiraceae bacterium]
MKKWNYLFDVPDQKKVRMIVHADCKNESDDQFALAHHLMTPKLIVKGIIGGHFNGNPQEFGVGQTAAASTKEIHTILGLMGLEGAYPVLTGSEYPLEDEFTPRDNAAVRFIIEEAMKDDPHPLFIGMQGAVTDLASAILIEPAICSRMTCIWIGGGDYPKGAREFNLEMDIAAANVLMKSEMPLWQVPMSTYKTVSVSLAELQYQVAPCGELGRYLFEHMVRYNQKKADDLHWPNGEIWGLGDSPTVGLLLTEQERTDLYDLMPAPAIRYEDMTYDFTDSEGRRPVRVYKNVDPQLTLRDFYAKLHINFG